MKVVAEDQQPAGEQITAVAEGEQPAAPDAPTPYPQRSFLTEWTVTLILLLFGTTTDRKSIV